MSGKTTLFNKIKSYLARTGDNGGIELELSGEHDGIDYIFVDEGHIHPEDFLEHLNGTGFAEDALADICKRANRMLRNIHGVFDEERNLLHLKNGKIIMPPGFAYGPKVILYFAALIALREHRGTDLPLIVDDLGAALSPVFRHRLVHMIADNTAQVLIFISWNITTPVEPDWDLPAGGASLYDDMKSNGTLGSLYELKYDPDYDRSP